MEGVVCVIWQAGVSSSHTPALMELLPLMHVFSIMRLCCIPVCHCCHSKCIPVCHCCHSKCIPVCHCCHSKCITANVSPSATAVTANVSQQMYPRLPLLSQQMYPRLPLLSQQMRLLPSDPTECASAAAVPGVACVIRQAGSALPHPLAYQHKHRPCSSSRVQCRTATRRGSSSTAGLGGSSTTSRRNSSSSTS
jgi:hypothetical protein